MSDGASFALFVDVPPRPLAYFCAIALHWKPRYFTANIRDLAGVSTVWLESAVALALIGRRYVHQNTVHVQPLTPDTHPDHTTNSLID
jgi:hypothetical protein